MSGDGTCAYRTQRFGPLSDLLASGRLLLEIFSKGRGTVESVFLAICDSAIGRDKWTEDGNHEETFSEDIATLPECRNDHEFGYMSGMCGYRRISLTRNVGMMGNTVDEDKHLRFVFVAASRDGVLFHSTTRVKVECYEAQISSYWANVMDGPFESQYSFRESSRVTLKADGGPVSCSSPI